LLLPYSKAFVLPEPTAIETNHYDLSASDQELGSLSVLIRKRLFLDKDLTVMAGIYPVSMAIRTFYRSSLKRQISILVVIVIRRSLKIMSILVNI